MSRSLVMATLASLALASSAFAQTGGMMSDKMAKPMHMSKSDMKMMRKCEAMSHDAMMKSGTCMKMMKMHPDMMKSSTAMPDGKMSHQ